VSGPDESRAFLVSEVGEVYAGRVQPFEAESFGWLGPNRTAAPDRRRSLDQLASLLARANAAGGSEPLLRTVLPSGDWSVVVF
jgi:hypothetical protein